MLSYMQERMTLIKNGIREISGSGAPVNGTTGAGDAGPGSTYTDYTNNRKYLQIGTISSPVWFDATSGEVKCIRRRFTIAEVNAATNILTALAGYKYRLVDATMIAIGGNVGAATTIDIIGVQSAANVKLLAVAIAALTQSAVVRAGATNATVLANGASFEANDTNSSVWISKTGASATTATHIDVIVYYLVEKA